jgi:Fe-S cluster biosynthesis and repair protein YggX
LIIKHVPVRSIGKSNFAELVKYITDAQSKDHRLGAVTVTNCHSDRSDAAALEVLATQQLNTRAKGDKTYHLIVSFRPGEQVDGKTLAVIEDRICAALGFGEHQRVSAVHNDTDNLHIHLSINKIHPVRLTMHEPFQAYRTFADLCVSFEREFGLQVDNHEAKRTVSRGKAEDMERHSGIESLVGWIQKNCLQDLLGAETWDGLATVLQENGLSLRERGNGYVIDAGDGIQVKASTVHRELSKPALTRKFGPVPVEPVLDDGGVAPSNEDDSRNSPEPLKPAPVKQVDDVLRPKSRVEVKRRYKRDPIRLPLDTTALYAKYKAESNIKSEQKIKGLQGLRTDNKSAIENIKADARRKRRLIKAMDVSPLTKKLLYARVYEGMKKDMARVHAKANEQRKDLYSTTKRRTWADWLKDQAMAGDEQALAALRARAYRGIKTGGQKLSQGAGLDGVTKKGTVIYKAGQSAVRDDGQKLMVSDVASKEAHRVALFLAVERYGSKIQINGSVEFKNQMVMVAAESGLPVTFADPQLEQQRMYILKTIKEQSNGKQQSSRGFGRGDGSDRAAGRRFGDGSGRVGRGGRVSAQGQSGVGTIGQKPPAQRRDHLQNLSSLPVVHFAKGSEVLLPGDVPRKLEQQGAERNNGLRWARTSGVMQTPEAMQSADTYIAEREAKRNNNFDISKYGRYTGEISGTQYGGIRRVNNQALLLLKTKEGVQVLPVDEKTAIRLSRLKIGDAIKVTEAGITREGRGR